MNKRYWNIFVAISILISSIIFGTYKQSLSSKLGEIQSESILAATTCRVLAIVLMDVDHCNKEYKDYLLEQKALNE